MRPFDQSIEMELKSILGHIKYIMERTVVVNKRDNHKKAPINTYFQRKKKEFFQSNLGGACVNLIKLLTRIHFMPHQELSRKKIPC